MFRMKAIGIDLGTSKCCVGIFRDGKVEILENERGNKTTPSYVAFTDTKRLVGEDAKNHATLNPANTVFGVKRIIGREWKDGLRREAVDKMPFTIMNNSEAETCIRASYKGTEELLLPQQITAMLLGKMKDLAELHLKSKVEEAVISVPASFSNAQRQATKDAAAIAGLKVLALINEPTAAAIAYQANRRKTDEENVAVVDFGAGNLSVAIVTVRRGQVIVRAVSGSTGVGGDEIDIILMEYVSRKFINKYGQERLDSSVLKERLRSCCEKLKRKLTLLPEVQETLDCFSGDIVLPVTITRDEFNSIIPSGTKSALMNSIDRAREASRIPKEKISRVVLVGGSSRIPLFRTWLANLFESKLLDKSVNPDEAVAYGATLYAALICGDNELREFELKDTVPNDFFYISEEELAMKRVFDHKSSITLPKQRVYICQSQSPFNKRSLKQKIKFYEGRHGEENPQLICTLCLDKELGQSIKYIKQITFDIDCCGIFNAVVQLEPHQVFPEVLNSYAGKLNENKLQYFTARERQLRKDDQDERERVEAMSNLEVLSLSLHSAMDDSKTKELFPEVVKQISDEARENIQWLDGNYSATKEKCEKRLNQLEKLKSDLEYKIKQYEKTEKHRLTAVKNFKLYCSSLETIVITGMGDEPELFSELSELWEGATKWLNSSEIKSKENCDDRKRYMMEVQVKIEEKLEIKWAVDDLKKYCSKLHDMKFEGIDNDCARDEVRLITEENIRCMNYIRENEFISRAECDSWKQKMEKRVVEVTSFLMKERLAAIASLESCCTHLEKLTRGIKEKDTESRQIASDATNLLNKTRQWLSETKNVTTAECDNRQKVIQSCLDEINDRKRSGGLAWLGSKVWGLKDRAD